MGQRNEELSSRKAAEPPGPPTGAESGPGRGFCLGKGVIPEG